MFSFFCNNLSLCYNIYIKYNSGSDHMGNTKLENLLTEIEAMEDTQTYIQVAFKLKELTNLELDEFETLCLINSPVKVIEKVQKAVKYAKSKFQNVEKQQNSVADILKKLDNISVDQLLQIKGFLESKPQLSSAEVKFIELLESKINSRSVKR